MEEDRTVTDEALGLSYRLFGAAPVQAEGTVGGRAFYFRARHEEWTFGDAAADGSDPMDVESSAQGFFREGQYGQRDEASYMPFETAEAIINRCTRAYWGQWDA